MGTLEDYIIMLWYYEPKDKKTPVLSKFFQTELTGDPERYKNNPERFLNNTAYAYRVKARIREKLKYHKHHATSAGNDPVVKNIELLADKVEDLYNSKVPLGKRTELLGRGVGIALKAPAAKPARVGKGYTWSSSDEQIAADYKKSMGSLREYVLTNLPDRSYNSVKAKRARLRKGSNR